MRSLFELLKRPDEEIIKELTKHERFKMLDEIFKMVNTDRKRDGYKEWSMKTIAVKTGHLSVTDMHFLLKKMQHSLNPGYVFNYSLKVKK